MVELFSSIGEWDTHLIITRGDWGWWIWSIIWSSTWPQIQPTRTGTMSNLTRNAPSLQCPWEWMRCAFLHICPHYGVLQKWPLSPPPPLHRGQEFGGIVLLGYHFLTWNWIQVHHYTLFWYWDWDPQASLLITEERHLERISSYFQLKSHEVLSSPSR